MHSGRRNEQLKFFEEKLKVSPGIRHRVAPLTVRRDDDVPPSVDKLRSCTRLPPPHLNVP